MTETEVLEWVPVGEWVPDADLTVLAYRPDVDDPVWPAYLDLDGWRDACTGELLAGDVTHWAEPKGPT